MSLRKKPNTLLLNTIIKYDMNKRSQPISKKYFFTPKKTFQLSWGVVGKENTDFVSFVTILPIFAAKRPD